MIDLQDTGGCDKPEEKGLNINITLIMGSAAASHEPVCPAESEDVDVDSIIDCLADLFCLTDTRQEKKPSEGFGKAADNVIQRSSSKGNEEGSKGQEGSQGQATARTGQAYTSTDGRPDAAGDGSDAPADGSGNAPRNASADAPADEKADASSLEEDEDKK